jgi:hypothetical protein
MKLVFLETPVFTRLLGDYLTDESYRELQRALMENPEMGDVMPGTGGFRKVRWEDARRGKGKRGDCGSSTTTSLPITKFSSSHSMTRMKPPI